MDLTNLSAKLSKRSMPVHERKGVGGNKGDRLLFPRCYRRRLCDRPLPCQESHVGNRLALSIM